MAATCVSPDHYQPVIFILQHMFSTGSLQSPYHHVMVHSCLGTFPDIPISLSAPDHVVVMLHKIFHQNLPPELQVKYLPF